MFDDNNFFNVSSLGGGEYTPIPLPQSKLPNKHEYRQQNLDCAKKYGLPECLVHRTCTPEEVGYDSKSDKESEHYKKGRCWELCVALKRNPENSALIRKQMKTLGCDSESTLQQRMGEIASLFDNKWLIGLVAVGGLFFIGKKYKWF